MVRSVLVAVSVALLAACAPNGAGQGVGVIVAEAASDRRAVDGDGGDTRDTAPDRSPAEVPTTAAAAAAERVPPADIDTLVAPAVARPMTVAVVGDSLTLSAEDEIVRTLNAGGMHVLAIDGVESRRMAHGDRTLPPGTDAVDRIRAEHEPGIWVIALGTNDVASVGSAEGFQDQMRDVLALIPEDDPVIWVDLWIEGWEEPVSHANRLIRAELRRRQGGAAVVDWFSHGMDDGVITADGVHLTQSGQNLYAASIASAIDELFVR